MRQGLISNLGNPKMAAFFLSLLPQFVTNASGSLAAFALGLLFCLMTLGWLSIYAMVLHRVGHLFQRPQVRHTLDAITGTVLVALGLRLAAEARSPGL